MTRPLPIHLRARREATAARRMLLCCPRRCPQWELLALRSLMKPKGEPLHHEREQAWPANADAAVVELLARAAQRLQIAPPVHLRARGEYHLAVEFDAHERDHAAAVGLVLSTHFPRLWFVLDRLLIRNGRFIRRWRGHRVELVRATNVRLPRPLRMLVKDLILPTPPLPDDPPAPRVAQRRRAAFFTAVGSRRTQLQRHRKQCASKLSHPCHDTP